MNLSLLSLTHPMLHYISVIKVRVLEFSHVGVLNQKLSWFFLVLLPETQIRNTLEDHREH